jgi:dTMP kinase
MSSRVSKASDRSASSPRVALDRGALITFEGPDGSGKSTLAHGCKGHLENEGYGPVGLFREPGMSPAGRRLRELKLKGRGAITPEEEFSLFLEDRRWDVETNIQPILSQRGVVLLDRYYHSSMAYQGARGLDPAEIRAANETFAPRPDLIVLLRLSVDECLERIRRARGGEPDLFEERESLRRVTAIFDALDDESIVRFEAGRPLEDLQREVNRAVASLLRLHHA